ncbi:TetR/AcrR family transcriptional regulator [Gryllotalpicola reticulitermitis]|uniref:TetR/AcrR family transcriptional regulator n=1 Tax=Gryllotalpicola reticulitermitis TaxID=1184153 RepID=A0ABV8Q4E4_9MICO
MVTQTARPKRADATRNVDALVEAAKSVFAARGVDAPAKEITDAAGVGVGTLYRHFPRRSDLIIAVLQRELDECVAAAEALGGAPDAWGAVDAWIARFTGLVATKSGLAQALHSGDAAYAGLPQRLMDQLTPAFAPLLARAAAESGTDSGLTAREVLSAVALLCHPVAGGAPDVNERMVRTLLGGLR